MPHACQLSQVMAGDNGDNEIMSSPASKSMNKNDSPESSSTSFAGVEDL